MLPRLRTLLYLKIFRILQVIIEKAKERKLLQQRNVYIFTKNLLHYKL